MQIKAQMKRAGVGRASMRVCRCPCSATSFGLSAFPIMQQFQNHVVELHKSHIQSLVSTSQIGNSYCRGIDLLSDRFDFVVQHQRVVNLFAMKVAIAHDFCPAKNLGVELEGAI